MGALGRIEQGIKALLAFAYPVDYKLAATYLDDAQLALFKQMGRSEQLHSLNVLRTLLAEPEPVPSDLAVAALLHDIGKIHRRLSVMEKTIIVLVEAAFPQTSLALSADEQLTFWRAPFVVRKWHPKWSAELLEEHQAPSPVIWLARHHAEDAEKWRDHPHYMMLLRLQHADNAN